LLEVEIVTPQKIIFTGKATSTTVPGSMGPFQVLFNHAPIVSTLETGIVIIVDPDNKSTFYATGNGFAEIRQNKVSILVESAVEASEVNKEEITKTISEKKDLLKTLKSDEAAKVKAEILIAENQLKTAGKASS
jgi:F-type H+-transporting ATPase subunit epsilon